MKYIEPSIVIVDDVKHEIQGILNYYNELGMGCKWFNASYTDDDSDLPPEKVYSNVNLIFLDLFYSEQFDAEQCSNWVRSIVPEKSFYILVLWTKDQSKAGEVIELLNTHKRNPFVSLVKSKTDFNVNDESKYNFIRLFEEINAALDNFPALDEIQIWKNNINFSSNRILGSLIQKSDPIVFTNKLKKIIVSHGGTTIKTNSVVNAKRQILFEALDTILVANTANNYSNPISPDNETNLYDLSQIEEPIIDKELNSWFHFKLNKDLDKNLILPGLISEFKDNDWKKMYSIHDDKNVSLYIGEQIKNNSKISSIAMVLSRPCDVAQQKFGKNIKLLSGLIILKPKRKGSSNKDFHGGSPKPDSIKVYDHLFFTDEKNDVSIIFDYRYSFSIPEDIFKNEFNNIIIFNKELISEIQVEYSNYSSRLGITQIY